MIRIANKQMSEYVTNKVEFQNSKDTAFARFKKYSVNPEDDMYIVYSYGLHFPMYAFDYKTKMWFGNESKYSVTTTRHMTQARPKLAEGEAPIQWMSTGDLHKLIDAGGYAEYAAKRVMRT